MLAAMSTRFEAIARGPALDHLVAAYPDHIARIEDGNIIWKDGGDPTPVSDGKDHKTFDEWLENPDIDDIFRYSYPGATPLALAIDRDVDPGRARPSEFFDRIYGDCTRNEVVQHLVDVVWLPAKRGQKIKFSSVNGAAAKLTEVSRELDNLDAQFDKYLLPIAGTYNCRPIAGSTRVSAHGHGIAIDLALKHAHYWRWSKPDSIGVYAYQNQFPVEIVHIFEKHGFIWGGRWYHYDTMHFEYRPELLRASTGLVPPSRETQSNGEPAPR